MVSGLSHPVVALVYRAGLVPRGLALLRLHLHVRQLPDLRECLLLCGESARMVVVGVSASLALTSR